MARRVRLQRREGVALISLGSGPAGAGFDAGLRAALDEALDGALDGALDAALGPARPPRPSPVAPAPETETETAPEPAPDLKAIVLRAEPGGWPQARDPAQDYASGPGGPDLGALCTRIAFAPVPVVAVLTGTISGGALALSQAAGLRLALASTRFVCPEFGLGLLPAAGALVRLVRRVGAVAALDFVLAGRAVQGEAAMALGLCDAVASEGTIETAALTEALRVAALGAAAPFAPREGALEAPGAALDALAAARPRLMQGPLAATAARLIEVAEAALLLPFDAALAFEAVAFQDLAAAPAAAALRYLAAAQQAGGQLAGLAAAAPVPPVHRVGLWNQPDRLALALIGRGVTVRFGATDPAQLQAAVTAVAQAQEAAVQAGRVSAARRDADWARLDLVAQPAELGAADPLAADLILATPADAGELAALRGSTPGPGVLALSAVAPRGAELGFARARGLALVWAAPRPADGAAKPVPEPVPDPEPDPQAVAERLRRLAAVLRAEGAVVVHGTGLAARLEAVFVMAAERAVLAGARPQAVDAALTEWGFGEGPFARLDRLGLGQTRARLAPFGFAPGPWLSWLALEGRDGRAGGAGVFDYPAGAALGEPMAEEGAVLAALRREAGVAPQALPAAEIVARVLAELAGAGAAALQQGAAHRASDLDLVAGAFLALAPHRGGPMFQADRGGLLALRKRLRALAEEGAPPPVRLLDVLIRNGRSFAEL